MNAYARYNGDGSISVRAEDIERVGKSYKTGDLMVLDINTVRSAQQLKFLWAIVGQAWHNWNEQYPKPASVEQLMQTLKYECGLTEEKRRMCLKTGEVIIEMVPMSIKLASLSSKRMNDFTSNVLSVLSMLLGITEDELSNNAKLNIKD